MTSSQFNVAAATGCMALCAFFGMVLNVATAVEPSLALAAQGAGQGAIVGFLLAGVLGLMKAAIGPDAGDSPYNENARVYDMTPPERRSYRKAGLQLAAIGVLGAAGAYGLHAVLG